MADALVGGTLVGGSPIGSGASGKGSCSGMGGVSVGGITGSSMFGSGVCAGIGIVISGPLDWLAPRLNGRSSRRLTPYPGKKLPHYDQRVVAKQSELLNRMLPPKLSARCQCRKVLQNDTR